MRVLCDYDHNQIYHMISKTITTTAGFRLVFTLKHMQIGSELGFSLCFSHSQQAPPSLAF